MKPQERIAELEKQLATMTEQRDGLLKRLKELEALGTGRGKSKSKLMAEEALKLLEAAGQAGVPLSEFAKLNPKYPSDVAFYLRSMRMVETLRPRSSPSNRDIRSGFRPTTVTP